MDSISKVVNMESIAVLRSQAENMFLFSNLSCFPPTSLPTNPPKFVRLKARSTLSCNDQVSNRKFKKMQPSPWPDRFHSVSTDVSEMDALKKEIDILKPKVKNTLMSYQGGIHLTKKRIIMIYLLKSLGLAYHFEEEIYETLKEDFGKVKEMMAGENDLYTVSIIFLVFRTYGHYISSDVFTRFKGIDGNFKEFLNEDAKGILSLYEAAHLRTTTDYILEEALSFASSHLGSLASSGTCPTHLSMRIRNALTVSQRWNMEIVATMEYISSYEQEKDHDEMLLKFAKISFKLVQLQYIQELKILSKWYKDLDFASNLPPYFRDRMVENYFFVLAVFFEPQLSRGRSMFTKFYVILTLLDDTFDRYATLSEAECLTNSVKRWAADHAMDRQPDYLKYVFNSALDTLEEFERELRPEGTSYCVKATIEEVKIIEKSTCDLEKWAQVAHVPSFEEYMEVGEVEIGVYASMACIFMCLGNKGTKEAYEWLHSRPKLVKSIAVKARLVNDITGFKDDTSRRYVPNAVSCYMKQYGVTEQEAIRKLLIMVADADKATNEELLSTIGVSRFVLKAAIRLSQMITLAYNGYEGFTFPDGKTKEYMTSIFVDLIHI